MPTLTLTEVPKMTRASRKEYHKKYYAEHKEKLTTYTKIWQAAHPEKVKEWRQKREARKRLLPEFKLKNRMACAVKRLLKGKSKAGRPWETLVGYTIYKLKRHLEKLFTPQMSWENYGTYWVIDHKIPVSAFNFEKPEDIDFKRCWALKNLQPLEAKQNHKKGAKLAKPFQPSLTI